MIEVARYFLHPAAAVAAVLEVVVVVMAVVVLVVVVGWCDGVRATLQLIVGGKNSATLAVQKLCEVPQSCYNGTQ